jgi:fatty acid desaturase
MSDQESVSQQGQLLEKAELREMLCGSNHIYIDLAMIYGLLIACIAVLSLLHQASWTWAYVPLGAAIYVVIGWGQFCLSNGQHEAIHHNFGAPHRESISMFLTAYPIGLTRAYRQVHFNHHRYFGDAVRDPDYGNYANFPASKLALLKRLLINVSGFIALRQFLRQETGQSSRFDVAQLVVVQLIILALFSMVTSPLYYCIFWLLPIITIARCCSFMRTFCEHANEISGEEFTYRSINGSTLQTLVLGMFRFNYHAEHHLYPSVPYPHLPRTSQIILQRAGPDQRIYEIYNGGYLGLLFHWSKSLPWVSAST